MLYLQQNHDYPQQCSSMSAIYDVTIKHNIFVIIVSITHEPRLTTADMFEPGIVGEAAVPALFNDATSVQRHYRQQTAFIRNEGKRIHNRCLNILHRRVIRKTIDLHPFRTSWCVSATLLRFSLVSRGKSHRLGSTSNILFSYPIIR